MQVECWLQENMLKQYWSNNPKINTGKTKGAAWRIIGILAAFMGWNTQNTRERGRDKDLE